MRLEFCQGKIGCLSSHRSISGCVSTFKMISHTQTYLIIGLAFAAVLQNDDQIDFYETAWFQRYWTLSLPIALLYVLLLFTARPLLCKTNACVFQQSLKYWNYTLALFSILGFYRVGGEFLDTWRTEGLEATICQDDYSHSKSVYFWYFLFVGSKILEMGDSLLLLMGNKPVRFIHWFHHALTMIYAWYIAAYLPAIGRWFSVMNFAVHSLMYTYYFLQANHIRVSRKISMLVTSLQILQMFIGLAVSVWAFTAKNWLGRPCGNAGWTSEAGIALYSFYCGLFVNFFCTSYLRKGIAIQ